MLMINADAVNELALCRMGLATLCPLRRCTADAIASVADHLVRNSPLNQQLRRCNCSPCQGDGSDTPRSALGVLESGN